MSRISLKGAPLYKLCMQIHANGAERGPVRGIRTPLKVIRTALFLLMLLEGALRTFMNVLSKFWVLAGKKRRAIIQPAPHTFDCRRFEQEFVFFSDNSIKSAWRACKSDRRSSRMSFARGFLIKPSKSNKSRSMRMRCLYCRIRYCM